MTDYKIEIEDSGDKHYTNRILIGTATTGLVRIEWVQGRYGQLIPINWSQVQYIDIIPGYYPLQYLVADAQNLIVQVALERGFEWCFRGNTLVETVDGAKHIRDISVGEKVKKHTEKWNVVTKTMKRPIKQSSPILWITTGNSTIKCTSEHPFYALVDGKKQFIMAKDLTISDYLLYPYQPKIDNIQFDIHCNTEGSGYHNLEGSIKNGKHINIMEVDEELARFFGLYLAEGHSERDAIAFTFANDEADLIGFVSLVYRNRFERNATIRSNWATQVRLNIRNLTGKFREWFGKNA